MGSITTIDNVKAMTVTAGAAITKGQLLTLAEGLVASVSGLTGEPVAVALQDIDSGEIGAAKPLAYGNTYIVKADATGVSADDPIYGAAAGVGSATQGVGAFRVGIALTDGAASGLFELLYKPGFTAGAE